MFRRNDPPRVREAIAITLEDLKALEKVLLNKNELMRLHRPDISMSSSLGDSLLASLYQRAGAASVTYVDADSVRIPLYRDEFLSLETAILTIERYGRPDESAAARNLLNQFNALLGRTRAIVHMGGTPVFDPSASRPELPSSPH